MSGYFFALGLCILLVLFLIHLMRQRRLREKYAVLWLGLAIVVTVMGAFPNLVAWLATLVGVELPSNLLFAAAITVLLGVCIQLSTEITAIEEETRTLAEEVALLRLDLSLINSDDDERAAADMIEVSSG